MKKKCKEPGTGEFRFKKILLVMRLTLFLMVLAVLSTSASSYGQKTKLDLNFENRQIREILNQIEDQSEYSFMYDNKQIDVEKRVSLDVKSSTIEEILSAIFEESGITYKIIDRHIMLIPGELSTATQQQKTIRGNVADINGLPLPGVTVIIKGTTQGTITDLDGKYSISNVPADAILVFSFVGMKSQEVQLDGRTSIDVTLVEETVGLEEVVAIGYGTQKRVTVTGAVASTKGEDLVKSKTPNVLNSITGHLPGVIINSRSGEPGKEDPSILIRGKSTTGESNPLILIDGVERPDLGRINPNDIESISILKDASAAIYGARAANGVILVTTKRGEKGAPVFNFSYNQGFSQPTREPKMADSYTFAKVYNEIETQAGRAPKYTQEELDKFKAGTADGYRTTNWYDRMIKTLTPQHQTNLSVAGGSEKLDYYISIGEMSQDGHFNYGSTEIKRYNFRSNLNVHVSDYLEVGLDVSGRYDNKHYPGNDDTRGVYSHIFLYLPMWELHWPGTDYLKPNRDNQNLVNWISDNSGYTSDKYKAVESKLHFLFKVPGVDGLSFRGSANYDAGYNFLKRFSKPDYVYYQDPTTQALTKGRSGEGSDLAQLVEEFSQTTTLTMNAQANYDHSFGKHNLGVLLGYEQMEYSYDYLMAGRTDFPSTVLPELFAGSSEKSKQSNDGTADKTSRQNYFGRITYDYAQKYMAQLIMRYDGSPNFPENKRWGFFPGMSVGWRISEEAFMQDLTFLDNLKLRASYGEMGNDAVPPFQYMASYKYDNNYVIGGTDVIGLVQSGVPNPYITWETAKTTNLGFESTLWEGALAVEFDYFKTRRSNILTKRTAVIPDYTGLVLPDENVGIVENKGFELLLSHRKVVNDKLRYSISGNISYAKNKVIFADEAPAAEPYQLATGRPIGSALYYDAIGIYSTADAAELSKYPGLPGVKAGDIIYRDANNDGTLNSRDMIRVDQTATPEIVYGLNLSIEYGSFDCAILFQGQENATTYLANSDLEGDTRNYLAIMNWGLGNFTQWRADGRWTEENTVGATQPRGDNSNGNNNTELSTHWLQDAGFLRLKNVEIGYTLPSKLCQQIGVDNVRAYVSGNNLMFIYDNMKDLGFDPEASDFWFYSPQRTFNIGINLTF